MAKLSYKKQHLENIIKLAQNKDIKALEELIKRVQKRVWVFFSHVLKRKEDVSDLTQEALVKMAKSISQLNNPQNFKTWLNQIVTNIYYDNARKKNIDFVEISDEKFQEIRDKLGCEPGEKCLFSEIEKLINTALLTLPKDLRITLVLREYEGLSYNDIAQITNTAVGTVKSRISRARLKLQEELKDFI